MPSDAPNKNDKPEDAMAQIAHLRAQVEALMREKVAPTLEDVTERMEDAAHEAADAMRGQAEIVAEAVRRQPFTALLVAAAIGFLLGRTGR